MTKWAGSITIYMPECAPLAVAFDASADHVLTTRPEALVIVLPTKEAAREFGMALSLGKAQPHPLVVCGSDQWRGTRKDQPQGALVCLRHTGPGEEFSASEDLARYRQWMRAEGLTPAV